MASCLVYRRAAAKRRVTITPHVETLVLDALKYSSQQAVARQLGLSQSTVSKIANRKCAETGQ